VNREQHRRILEAIALSRDSSLSASDRLRALDALERLGLHEAAPGEWISREVSSLSGPELDGHLDALLAGAHRDGTLRERFPYLVGALEHEIVQRARPVSKVAPPPENDDAELHAGRVALRDGERQRHLEREPAQPARTTYDVDALRRHGIEPGDEVNRGWGKRRRSSATA
jgi:hypothetical protein